MNLLQSLYVANLYIAYQVAIPHGIGLIAQGLFVRIDKKLL